MKTIQSILALATAISLTSLSAHAVSESDASVQGATIDYESTYDSFSTNLLTSATITDNGVTPDYGSSYAGLTDLSSTLGGGNAANNAYFGNGVAGNSLASNPVVTFTLDTSAATGSPTGYDLTSITSVYGWQNYPSMSDQNYTVWYTTVSDPTFTELASVSYAPFTDATPGPYTASQVVLTDLTSAVGVNAIQFDFTTLAAGQSGQMVHEIEVTGDAAPEPSTWALIGLGALVLAWRLRRGQIAA